MKKLPNYRGRITLFMTICLFMSAMLLETVKAGDSKVPPQATVSGTVTDTDGLPLAGVHIQVESTKKGTISDLDGAFTIEAGPNDQLIFSIMGFKSLNVSIADNQFLDVQLQQDVTQLGEVVLNAGYYTVTERERTGNISKVDIGEIERQPVSNPLAALQGRMPGVNITQFSGLPGSRFTIQIRGRNSIASGNEPLYIVDGVPFSNEPINFGATAAVLGGSISPLNGINPGDILSIEVLKDADATSIYGSRGANGVVLITTKKGQTGKAKLDIHINSSLGRVTRFMELLNTEQYLEMRREAFVNDGISDYPSNAYDVNGTWSQNRYTDWQKEFIGGTVFRTMVQASLSGGSNTTRYLMSGSFQDENTVFPGENGYTKGGVLMNLAHNSEDGKLNLQFSGNYVVDQNELPASDLTILSNTLAPNAPALYTSEGELNWEDNTWNNPLAQLVNRFTANTQSLIANAMVSYTFVEGMMAKVNLGYTDTQVKDSRILPSTSANPSWGVDSRYSTVFKGNSSRKSWILEPQIQFKREFGPLQLDILLGTSFQNLSQEQLGLYGKGFSSNQLLGDISAASYISVHLNTKTDYKYHAVFGRFNLNYQNKYFLNLTARRDGSSRFGPGKQFADFSAIGAAWLFSEEDIIKENLAWISYGKLRGSYGTTGNDQIGDYQFLESYSLGGVNYDGFTTLVPSRLYNPNFGWERNNKFEVGIDLGLLKDRLMLSGVFYQNRSSNQLVGIPMPGTTGFNSIQANLEAVVQNQGLEFEMNSQLLDSPKIKWNIGLNLTIPKNELISFPGLEESTYANRFVIGKPLGITKLYYSTGVDPTTGIFQFRDYDQDGNITAANDKQWIADRDPKYFGGLNNQLSWNAFELNFLFQFAKQGNWNNLYHGSPPGLMNNQSTSILDRWQSEGDNAPMQRYTTGNNFEAYSAFSNYGQSNETVSDASYVRLKSISLSYKIPPKVTKGMECSVYIQGQNLLTFTKYRWGDPEFLGTGWLPPLKQITLGTQLTF